jgi:rhamnosyltransferase
MLRVYQAHPERERIGLVAPRYCEEESGLMHSRLKNDAPESSIVTTSMMSGNLVRTDVIAQVGFYDEGFFIDYVDHEFCLRLGRHGFQVLESNRSVLKHNLGRMTGKRVAGVLLTTTNHSALRRYYNARNRTLVYRRYGRSVPGWVARDFKSFLVETAKILLLEKDRRAKLINIAKGIWQGLLCPSRFVSGQTAPYGSSR